jgi:coenzyme F420-reducing hydrogenase delta subunit/DNA-binding CsgD family transcriptional regulator
MRLIRVMCSGRVDLEFIFRAFANGQDGVFIGGCRLDECNYITHGNYDALANTHLARRIMAHMGLNPERLKIQFMSGADGQLLAEATSEFARKVTSLGPLGKGEGLDPEKLKLKLEAARKLVPYIRLVERERLRIPVKSEKAFETFYTGTELDRLFRDLIGDRLTQAQIMLLLKERALSTGEIAGILDLTPSEVSRHMNSSSRQGLVRYDTALKRYAVA